MNTLSYCVAMQHMANEFNLTADKLDYAQEALLIIDGLKDSLIPSEVMKEIGKIISHKNVIVNKTKKNETITDSVASLSGFDLYINKKITISRITLLRGTNVFNISYSLK